MPYGTDAARLRAFKANFGTSRLTGAPATLYVALARHESAPASTLGVEPGPTGGYARVAVANEDAAWTYQTAGGANAAEVRWPTATGAYDQPAALNQWIIYDNSAGGTVLAFGALTTTITVTGAGDVPVLPAGALALTIGA